MTNKPVKLPPEVAPTRDFEFRRSEILLAHPAKTVALATLFASILALILEVKGAGQDVAFVGLMVALISFPFWAFEGDTESVRNWRRRVVLTRHTRWQRKTRRLVAIPQGEHVQVIGIDRSGGRFTAPSVYRRTFHALDEVEQAHEFKDRFLNPQAQVEDHSDDAKALAAVLTK